MKKVFKKPEIRNYGSFAAVILSKKSSPGDGIFGNGVKGMTQF
ncbi:MAG: lariocidin family lasso peptide [Alphaproteobacteria bacterium]